MSLLNYVVVSIVGTILRFFPWPCKTGLYHIGVLTGIHPCL